MKARSSARSALSYLVDFVMYTLLSEAPSKVSGLTRAGVVPVMCALFTGVSSAGKQGQVSKALLGVLAMGTLVRKELKGFPQP